MVTEKVAARFVQQTLFDLLIDLLEISRNIVAFVIATSAPTKLHARIVTRERIEHSVAFLRVKEHELASYVLREARQPCAFAAAGATRNRERTAQSGVNVTHLSSVAAVTHRVCVFALIERDVVDRL